MDALRYRYSDKDYVMNNISDDRENTRFRITHSRFLKGKPVTKNLGIFDKIITTVWSFNIQSRILKYGSTIYTKDSPQDCWYRKAHLDTSKHRYLSCPIKVKIISNTDYYTTMSNRGVDWFISRNLVCKYGTHNKNIRESNSKIYELELIDPDFTFNKKYDPYFYYQLNRDETSSDEVSSDEVSSDEVSNNNNNNNNKTDKNIITKKGISVIVILASLLFYWVLKS